MNYRRGDVVILPFPFVTRQGVEQKARPALIISDHSITRRFGDVILAGITTRTPAALVSTELLVQPGAPEFAQSGLAKPSVIRCEYIMTIPVEIIAYKLGDLPASFMSRIDEKLRISLGLIPETLPS